MNAPTLSRRTFASGLALAIGSPLAAVASSCAASTGSELSAALDALKAAVAARNAARSQIDDLAKELAQPQTPAVLFEPLQNPVSGIRRPAGGVWTSSALKGYMRSELWADPNPHLSGARASRTVDEPDIAEASRRIPVAVEYERDRALWWGRVVDLEERLVPLADAVDDAASVLAAAPCASIADLCAKVDALDADDLVPDARDGDDVHSRSMAGILSDIRALAARAVANA